jgi:hypothetical protein
LSLLLRARLHNADAAFALNTGRRIKPSSCTGGGIRAAAAMVLDVIQQAERVGQCNCRVPLHFS